MESRTTKALGVESHKVETVARGIRYGYLVTVQVGAEREVYWVVTDGGPVGAKRVAEEMARAETPGAQVRATAHLRVC